MTLGLAEWSIGRYNLPAGTQVQLVSRSENEIYKLQAPNGQAWAMRLQRPGYQSRISVASELAWLAALQRDGVMSTPVPVSGCDSEWVQERDGRLVVLFHWLPGRSANIEESRREPIKALGALAARMHLHSRAWERPKNFERFTWNADSALGENARWGHWSKASCMDRTRSKLFSRTVDLIRGRLVRFGTSADRFGLAHCDLRLDNLLLHGEQIKVIDFDDCGFSWYMYDAATVVSFYEHLPLANELIRQWLAGYRTVAPVGHEEEEIIPTLVMMRRLMLLGWIATHPEADSARQAGADFTAQTEALCNAYLSGL